MPQTPIPRRRNLPRPSDFREAGLAAWYGASMSLMTGPLWPEYAVLKRVLVCPPAFFDLRQPINVIQERVLAEGGIISPQRAAANHAELVAALEQAGADVVHVEADPRHPYQINTRDAGLASPRGLILARFRLPIREGEEQLVRPLVESSGMPILGQPRSGAFEGGDFVALDARCAAVGIGARTEASSLPDLARLLGPDVELIGVPFADRFLHLDMIFNLVADGLALACRSALPPDFLERLRAQRLRLLDVDEEEVFRHGCNVLPLGPGRILSHTANGRVNALLRAEGLDVLEVDVSELARGGGGPRCLTLPLERSAA